ncbi:PilZ domain-containing protein [Microvirga subterranea]|uniref:PilZ domain-containing protein n=1 Tax=Microvirga subterranea TaxID=186651 RepID=UPI000E0A3718|nr:PilZ domain-containing protein [Microvirga subterranea]
MNPFGSRGLAAARPNLRRTRRLRVLQPAKIVFGADMMIHCEVRDISVGGARIAIKQHVVLPDRFELFICAHDLRVHTAKVRWRSGDFIGVSFGDDEAAGRSMMLPPPHQFAAQSYPALATSNLAVPAIRDDGAHTVSYDRSALKVPRASVQVGAQGWERRRLRSRRGLI